MACIKIPRAIEVTVTSELHAEAERPQKQKREEIVTSGGGSGRIRVPMHGGAGVTVSSTGGLAFTPMSGLLQGEHGLLTTVKPVTS